MREMFREGEMICAEVQCKKKKKKKKLIFIFIFIFTISFE